MAEQLDLTEPITTPPVTTANYRVVALNLNWEIVATPPTMPPEPGLVQVMLRDNNGLPFQHQYVGTEAIDMMKWLNTANFSVNSMHKRILQKLSNDGVLPGTVTGTPDLPAGDEVR